MAALILDEKWIELLGKKIFFASSKCNRLTAGTSYDTYHWWKPNKKQQLILLNFLKVGHFCPLLRLFLLFLMFNWKKTVQWSLLQDLNFEPLLDEATALPTEPPQLPNWFLLTIKKTFSCWESCHRRQQRHSGTRADLQLRLQASNLETWNL